MIVVSLVCNLIIVGTDLSLIFFGKFSDVLSVCIIPLCNDSKIMKIKRLGQLGNKQFLASILFALLPQIKEPSGDAIMDRLQMSSLVV